MQLQAHTPRWGSWQWGQQKHSRVTTPSWILPLPRSPTRKGGSSPSPRPSHLQPLRIHGSHGAGSQASGTNARRKPAEAPRAQGPAAQAQTRLSLWDAAGGAGWGGAALPLAAGGRGRALHAGICGEEVLRGSRCCVDPRQGLRGRGERRSDQWCRRRRGFRRGNGPGDSGWAGPRI